MKFLKKVSCFFDRISHEIRLMNLKAMIILSIVFLCGGIISWFVGGSSDKISVFFIFPRSALPLVYAYIFWAISFAFVGFIFGGILFGCEKYKRTRAQKIAIFVFLSFVFSFCVYPAFFGALSPFFAFLLLLVSFVMCLVAIFSSLKFYSLWTICLSIHALWLLYNCFVALSFTFVN